MKTKTKFFIFLVLGLLMLAVTAVLSYRNEQRVKPEKLTTILQERFLEKEQELNEYLAAIVEKKILDLDDLISFCEENKINSNEFVFYVYRQSELISWSSNSIALPYELQKKSTSGFQSLGFDYVYYVENHSDSLSVVGFYVLKKKDYTNHVFLSLNFLSQETVSQGIDLSQQQGNYTIKNNKGNAVFSLHYSEKIKLSDKTAILELILWLITFTFLLLTIFFGLLSTAFFGKHTNWIWIILSFVILLTLFVFSSFKIPPSLYSSNLFTSIYYASYLSSFGSLILQTYYLFIFAIFFEKTFTLNFQIKSTFFKYALRYLLIVLAMCLYIFVFMFLYSIINDTTITISPSLLYKYDELSLMILFSISCLFWVLALIFREIMKEVLRLFNSFRSFIYNLILIFIIVLAVVVFYYSRNYDTSYLFFVYLAIFVLFVVAVLLKIVYDEISMNIYYAVLFLLFGLIVFFISEKTNAKKLEQQKENFAKMLLLTEDPLMVYDLCEMKDSLRKDKKIIDFLKNPSRTNDAIEIYLNTQYFYKYIEQYKISFQIAYSSKQEDEQLIDSYNEKMLKTEKLSQDEQVGFLRIGLGKPYYIMKISYPFVAADERKDTAFLFFEMETNTNFIKPIANKNPHRIEKELITLSYAEYQNDTLKTYRETKVPYKLLLKKYDLDTVCTGLVFDADGFTHTVYRTADNNVLLLSTVKDSFAKKLSSVSFIFLILFVFTFVRFIIIVIIGYQPLFISFRGQMQRLVIFLLLGSTALAVLFFIHYTLSANKGEILRHSIYRVNFITNVVSSAINDSNLLITDESKEIDVAYLSNVVKDYIPSISIFNLKGNQIAFKQKKSSIAPFENTLMNPNALLAINYDAFAIYVEENVEDDNQYLILYKPLLNEKGEKFAYISYSNLERKSRIDYQLTNFFSTFLSFYGLFILIAVFIGTLMTRYVSMSLIKISNHLAKVKLLSVNEKIEWKRKDEIGLLIQEYNRLIDELEMSVELLSRSERESAWKDLAQQIAHDIKNPLTPMKLRTQQIRKEMAEGKIDVQKLNQYTEMLLNQIETINDITSSFYILTKIHQGEGVKENLIAIINNVLDLHLNQKHYSVVFENQTNEKEAFVYIQKTQLIRVFNNLIRNAVQASKEGEIQKIIIELSDYGSQMWEIKIKDFGKGMDQNTLKHAFVPRFTTKSTGMGLGLVMVKNIINDWNGTIDIESVLGQGTTFIIRLPRYSEEMEME